MPMVLLLLVMSISLDIRGKRFAKTSIITFFIRLMFFLLILMSSVNFVFKADTKYLIFQDGIRGYVVSH